MFLPVILSQKEKEKKIFSIALTNYRQHFKIYIHIQSVLLENQKCRSNYFNSLLFTAFFYLLAIYARFEKLHPLTFHAMFFKKSGNAVLNGDVTKWQLLNMFHNC